MTYEWRVYVRDGSYNRVNELDDYTSLTIAPVYNGVGTWSLDIPESSPMAGYLTTPGYGIVVTRDNTVVFTGFAASKDESADAKQSLITVNGFTDDAWLLSRLVSPSPGEASPPYTVQASDVRSGVASTVIRQYVDVNLGPSATPARRKAGLTIGTDPVVGATVRGEARWNTSLFDFIQTLAVSGGIGFRIVQVGAGLEFQTYQPVDRSADVKFSIALGNLISYRYQNDMPKANYVFVGASGTGTARIVNEFSDTASIATWGRWEGPLVNANSTANSTEISQNGTDALTQGAEQASLSIQPLEQDGLRYGIDYSVGDKVSIQLSRPAITPYGNSGEIVDILRKVEIKLTPEGQSVTPSIGTNNAADVSRLFRQLDQLHKRVNYLERQQ